MEWTTSSKVRFLRSDTPLPEVFQPESTVELFHNPSKLSTKIFATTIRSQCFNLTVKLIFYFFLELLEFLQRFWLTFSQNINPCLLKSSANMMKYKYPSRTLVLDRPHTLVWISVRSSEALSFVLLKGALAIFPTEHDSHQSNDSQSSRPRSPSSWSFLMQFLFIWLKQ